MRQIQKKTLEKLFSRLMSKLQNENIESIILDDDLYRFIPTDEWANYENDVILEGSLYDDIDSLNKLLENPQHICTYVDFDRFASVLRAISEKINPVSGTSNPNST